MMGRRSGQFGERGFGAVVIIILLAIAAGIGAMVITDVTTAIPEQLENVVNPLIASLN